MCTEEPCRIIRIRTYRDREFPVGFHSKITFGYRFLLGVIGLKFNIEIYLPFLDLFDGFFSKKLIEI